MAHLWLSSFWRTLQLWPTPTWLSTTLFSTKWRTLSWYLLLCSGPCILSAICLIPLPDTIMNILVLSISWNWRRLASFCHLVYGTSTMYSALISVISVLWFLMVLAHWLNYMDGGILVLVLVVIILLFTSNGYIKSGTTRTSNNMNWYGLVTSAIYVLLPNFDNSRFTLFYFIISPSLSPSVPFFFLPIPIWIEFTRIHFGMKIKEPF